MHVFFDPDGRPFLLGTEIRWKPEPNAFLARLSIVGGKTSSPRTRRSYAYQLADWLSFCDRIGVGWRHATELNLATFPEYPRIGTEPSNGTAPQTEHDQSQNVVICQFYRFAQKKGWIDALPFELDAVRVPYRSFGDLRPSWVLGPATGKQLEVDRAEGGSADTTAARGAAIHKELPRLARPADRGSPLAYRHAVRRGVFIAVECAPRRP